jgi:DnaK suppressor protein
MADALSEIQIAELRADLLTLGDELRATIDASKAAARPVDLDEPIGRLSRVDAMQQQGMVQANRNAAKARRAQIDAALARLEANEYGECLGCGEEVGFPRLKAKPEAALCIACQSSRERRA